MDHKSRAKKAIENYINKHETYRPKKRNQKPEEVFIHNLLMPWLEANGFSCNVVESKSSYSKDRQRYISQNAKPGISDIFGNYKNGLATFIEAKAPTCRNTLRDNQREFLICKINSGAFAVCTDSIEYIDKVWTHFKTLPFESRIEYLLSELPKQKQRESDDLLFED